MATIDIQLYMSLSKKCKCGSLLPTSIFLLEDIWELEDQEEGLRVRECEKKRRMPSEWQANTVIAW
eukprot:SAG31_NODE_7_length_42755_cov_130.245728_39_plen_66_part_00